MGVKETMKYAYSNARIKAMEAKLVGRQTMNSIIGAKDGSSMLSLLFQTDYKNEISEYGGMGIKAELIDFALSKNLARDVNKLYAIAAEGGQGRRQGDNRQVGPLQHKARPRGEGPGPRLRLRRQVPDRLRAVRRSGGEGRDEGGHGRGHAQQVHAQFALQDNPLRGRTRSTRRTGT